MAKYFQSADGKTISRGIGATNDLAPAYGGGWTVITPQQRPDLYPQTSTPTPTPTPSPVITPSTSSSFNLEQYRQGLQNGSITPQQAKDAIYKAFGNKSNSDEVIKMTTSALFANLGTVKLGNNTGIYDPTGNFIKQNTTVNVSKGGQNIPNEEALTLAKAMGATPEQINNLQNKLAGGATVSSDVGQKNDLAFQDLLKNPNLSTDDKTLLQKYYDTVSKNDSVSAAKLLESFNFGLEYSDPIFKAKAAIAKDALTNALSGNAGDLAFRENQLTNTLNDLKANTEASKGYLDFTHTQELEKLAKSYEQDLQTTRDNLASVGKTSSSVRSRAEQLLSENNTGLVESSNKQFNYQTGQLGAKLASSQRDLPLEVAQLKDEANRKRITALRNAETDLGSLGLSNLGYSGKDVLGDIPSEIGQNKIKEALNWSKLGMKFF